MGVIYADGLRWLLERCARDSLVFSDLGSGVNNLCAVAALLGQETTCIELNDRYYNIGRQLFDKLETFFFFGSAPAARVGAC